MLETTQTTSTQGFKPSQPERSRAVFCQEDFELIRTAVSQYLQQNQGKPDWAKYSNLYHRIGRLL
ncbi:hypothetical protein EPK99_05705 [Neorhizobium lilium]|uniref:Uncharacterized protein n=1 Tax=Neorhizobium lilium TaxID=2503024 RepID=A0A3S3RQ75_9HYPH|nr:hypothetical protein [Neorhizobium lilium]RWX81747.1 hypothetical protein EPK99_05705 [Neorhizobium lilium]